jgi:hypothetical protein
MLRRRRPGNWPNRPCRLAFCREACSVFKNDSEAKKAPKACHPNMIAFCQHFGSDKCRVKHPSRATVSRPQPGVRRGRSFAIASIRPSSLQDEPDRHRQTDGLAVDVGRGPGRKRLRPLQQGQCFVVKVRHAR